MVLIVDDKAENIFSLRRTLEVAGFEVDSAESGEEALKKILKRDYSLIILDVQMPGMDGFEVAETLQGYSKASDIPIIFLSAVSTEKKFITKGYQAGAVDYVIKPVDPDIFLLKVKTLHRLHEQNRELEQIRVTLLSEVAVRRKAEAELNNRVQELRSILHSIPQIAFTLSPEGKLEFYNEHWLQAIGQDAEMAVAYPEDAGVLKDLDEAIKRGEAFQAELRIQIMPGKKYRYHLLRIIPVKKESRILKWVGTFTDIHEQKTASDILDAAVQARTRELMLKNAELETSNYDLQQFASVASHDLQEPLRKIQIFGSIMQQRMLQEAPQAQENIGRIINIAGRMSTLINDLLDYSRLSVDNAFQPTDLNEIIRDIIIDLEYSIAEKSALIEVSSMPVIDAIPGQMRQMFQNLISNSLKFIRPGLLPVIRISTDYDEEASEGAECTITIVDNGIGFDEAYLGKIFTIFQRLNTKDTYEGTGIGLAIVKKIVEKHFGTITAKSSEGAGASFSITLPVRQASMVQESLSEDLE